MKANQACHRVATMCRRLGVSPSGYYAWRGRGRSPRAKRDEVLGGTIRAIHEVSGGTYGAPRVHAELMAGGCRVSRKRVARLMREAGLAGVSRRRGMRTTRVDQSHCVVPDRVERQFQADGPDRLWVADVTYVPTWTGFVYLAIVLDVFSRRVVGWSMTHHLRTELVLGALNMALGQRRPDGVVHHSDRGSQYTSLAFGKRCREMGVVPSTGRPGIASTTPWPRASLPRWSANSSTGARSVPRPKRAWRSSNSSKAGTTHAVVIRPWVTSAPTTSNGPRRRKRHVQCATLIVRLEPSPVLPGAASQRSRHTPRGHPIYRIGRRLYVHRLSPTSGLGTTALNCPLKRGNSIETFRKAVLALDSCISEEVLKLYVAYKAETNFVDVVPQKSRLRLSLNLKFHELHDPRGLAKDVTNLARWGNGDAEVQLNTLEELPYVMGLVRQAFEMQMGDEALEA